MIQRFVAKSRSHIAFVALLVVLAGYLGAKTLPEESWDGWGKGIYAAQTMLSLEHWTKDGIIHHKMLYIPIGYSSVVKLLDEPEMRHHARGTVMGGLIGRRLYYTHFPSGYVMPYAFLMKAGFTERHWFRLLSVVFSLGALVLMYVSFNMIAGTAVAFASTLYYGASTMFLDYADSINNQAVDELLRMAILFASLMAIRSITDKKSFMRRTALVCTLYFILAISSYDSTFFIFVWLVALDIISRADYRAYFSSAYPWKRWLVFAAAPVAAFLLQVAQNAWYLGWHTMLLDFKGVFASRSTPSGAEGGFLTEHFESIMRSITNMTGAANIALVIIIAVAYLFLRSRQGQKEVESSAIRLPSFAFVIAFFAAGLAFPFVFSNTKKFIYEGRQMAPFAALLTASATILLIRSVFGLGGLKKRAATGAGTCAPVVLMLVLFASLTLAWYKQGARTVEYVSAWPNNAQNVRWVAHLKRVAKLAGDDAVVFNLRTDATVRYPQPNPIDEYYLGMTALNFRDPEDFVRDWTWLKKNSSHPFDSLVVSFDHAILKNLAKYLQVPYDLEVINEFFILKIPAGVMAGGGAGVDSR